MTDFDVLPSLGVTDVCRAADSNRDIPTVGTCGEK